VWNGAHSTRPGLSTKSVVLYDSSTARQFNWKASHLMELQTVSKIILRLAIIILPSFLDVFVYYYAPGQVVNDNGGGTIIPVPPELQGGYEPYSSISLSFYVFFLAVLEGCFLTGVTMVRPSDCPCQRGLMFVILAH